MLVIMVVLVVGGVELNPGPRVEQEKIDLISVHMRNQERGRESKVIKSFWRPTIIKLEKMRNGNKELGVKFEKLSEAISRIAEYKQTEH
jgi:hypothetical protein